ncbi:MAG: hypothetical protein PVF75_08270 [Granulosicoccaceae bacterium]|jgi:hypothetical protein
MMTTQHMPTQVGSIDPELKTSPVIEEMDEEHALIGMEVEDMPTCYYNNTAFQDGDYVCAGTGAMLRCEKGVWVRKGSCDADNP